jgi:DNA-binding CsgD family transcriptional regulator/DNA-binding ferritin-like protein
MLLESKTAIIYGGGGTIGGAVARAFAREGAKVHLAGRTLDPLDQVAEEIRAAGGLAETAQVDALDEASVDEHADAVAARSGGIDVSLREESHAYRRAFSMHRMSHVVEAPMMAGGQPIGSVHFATETAQHDVGPADLRSAEAVADLMAQVVERIDSREVLERERDEARAAIDITGVPLVLSDPVDTELRLNDAARRLLGDVVDAEERLHRLLGRPAGDGPFSRRVEVELLTGESAMLLADSSPLHADCGVLVTVLELRREHAHVSPGALAALTAREADVVALVVDGLADRKIAETLLLSCHTVSPYVKRIYRKLDVDSRVGLTRLLLGAPRAG